MYRLHMGVGEPQSQSGRGGEKKSWSLRLISPSKQCFGQYLLLLTSFCEVILPFFRPGFVMEIKYIFKLAPRE
jgi:hypothetical protein